MRTVAQAEGGEAASVGAPGTGSVSTAKRSRAGAAVPAADSGKGPRHSGTAGKRPLQVWGAWSALDLKLCCISTHVATWLAR